MIARLAWTERLRKFLFCQDIHLVRNWRASPKLLTCPRSSLLIHAIAGHANCPRRAPARSCLCCSAMSGGVTQTADSIMELDGHLAQLMACLSPLQYPPPAQLPRDKHMRAQVQSELAKACSGIGSTASQLVQKAQKWSRLVLGMWLLQPCMMLVPQP